jgi:hypothetical protein
MLKSELLDPMAEHFQPGRDDVVKREAIMQDVMARVSMLVENNCTFRIDGFKAVFLLESEAASQAAEESRGVEQILKSKLLNFGLTASEVLRVVVHFEARG